jgi:hypothetical protein
MQNNILMDDGVLGPIVKVMQLMSRRNTFYQAQNQNQPTYFSGPYSRTHHSFNNYPVNHRTSSSLNNQGNIAKNYFDIAGFKSDACPNCLASITTPIGANNLILQANHICTFDKENAIKRLGPKKYFYDLQRLQNTFPEFLFRQCKDWANCTTGQLFLKASKVESSDKSETQEDSVQVDYDALPFLNKLLAQSKMVPNDTELYEFLKLAKNQTKVIMTFRVKPDQAILRYMIAVSTV